MFVNKIVLNLLFVILFFQTNAFSGSSHVQNKKFYADRYKFVENYIKTLKDYRKKNSKVFGSLAETIDGSMFVAISSTQMDSDKKALEECKKKKGKKCKVRFQSLKINKNYNRYAVHNMQKQTLEGSNYVLKVGYLGNYRGVIFLSNQFDLRNKDFECTKDKKRDKKISNIFSLQLKKYPLDFIKKSGLKFVVICGDTKIGSQNPIGMAPAHYDKSPGVFFVNSNQIKLAIQNNRMKIVNHVFHHEYYHIIDSELTLNLLDEEWVKLNKFPYNKKFEASDTKLLNDKKGFITNYAMNNEFEDKAELFANLVNDYDAVKLRIKSDRVLFEKTKLLIKRLKKISPKINKNFWDRLS